MNNVVAGGCLSNDDENGEVERDSGGFFNECQLSVVSKVKYLRRRRRRRLKGFCYLRGRAVVK